ncbi:MAG: hypothetical protein ACKVI6_04205 [Candidatus Poseidoniales archaeon]|jgi:arsenate reductase-like glutaredoxin family protein|tara:strand:- start:412 stop:735 length:324 start_codon:yes stop_codon:yes gene_type:complete
MAETSDIVKFQRWLQAQLSEAANIEDSKEKERRTLRLDSALSETILFRELIENLGDVIESPFVIREDPVRVSSNAQIKPEKTDLTTCSKCSGQIDQELGFCLLCGEY